MSCQNQPWRVEDYRWISAKKPAGKTPSQIIKGHPGSDWMECLRADVEFKARSSTGSYKKKLYIHRHSGFKKQPQRAWRPVAIPLLYDLLQRVRVALPLRCGRGLWPPTSQCSHRFQLFPSNRARASENALRCCCCCGSKSTTILLVWRNTSVKMRIFSFVILYLWRLLLSDFHEVLVTV